MVQSLISRLRGISPPFDFLTGASSNPAAAWSGLRLVLATDLAGLLLGAAY
jgi:hypothetical protein